MLLNTHRMNSQYVDITTQLKIASTKLHGVVYSRPVSKCANAERRSECYRYIFDIADRKITTQKRVVYTSSDSQSKNSPWSKCGVTASRDCWRADKFQSNKQRHLHRAGCAVGCTLLRHVHITLKS